jgi:hypothetical protein
MAVTRRPRRHWGRRLSLLALLTVAVLLAAAALRSRPSQGENVLAYLDQVRPEIQLSANEGADLADVRANAVTLGRDGITRRLDRLVNQTKATLSAIAAVTPPVALRVAHAYLVAAMGVRARAAMDARSAMAVALAQGAPDAAVKGLTGAGQEMELSDQAFALFTGSLPPSATGTVPTSAWVADQSVWTTQAVTVFVTTLRSSTSLSPIHDLAVETFVTDPVPVGNDNGSLVIPPTKGIQVSIVVADVGNQPEKHATVTATLHTDVSNTTETVRDFVDLTPGQQTALTIGSLHPLSGTTGTLTVAISPAPGQTDLTDNTLQERVELR